jgi:DNA-binding LacI/PurR family transcriptional regulator
VRKTGLTSLGLAKLAGVSSATVSRAFSGDARIRKETREHVLALAEEHGFRPNAIARSLNNRQSRLVALIVNTTANPAEGEGLDQLIHRLQAMERLPLVLCCADHEDRNQLMRLASAYQVEHVVLYSDAVSVEDVTRAFPAAIPIIASSEALGDRDLSDVRLDGAAATGEIVDHLVGLGRRHFVYLSGRASSHIDKQRRGWFATALERHGLAFDIAEQGDFSYESGYKETVLLLRRQRPDVLVCANDLMAIGAKDAAALLGLRVPEDLMLVGHDGVALANWDAHSITTIMPPVGSVSQALASLIDQPADSPPQRHVIACTVRWGRSTGERQR